MYLSRVIKIGGKVVYSNSTGFKGVWVSKSLRIGQKGLQAFLLGLFLCLFWPISGQVNAGERLDSLLIQSRPEQRQRFLFKYPDAISSQRVGQIRIDTVGHGRVLFLAPGKLKPITRRVLDSAMQEVDKKIDMLTEVGGNLQEQNNYRDEVDYWMKYLNAPGVLALIGLIVVILKRRKE